MFGIKKKPKKQPEVVYKRKRVGTKPKVTANKPVNAPSLHDQAQKQATPRARGRAIGQRPKETGLANKRRYKQRDDMPVIKRKGIKVVPCSLVSAIDQVAKKLNRAMPGLLIEDSQDRAEFISLTGTPKKGMTITYDLHFIGE
jgi:hypothetical protein